MKEILDQNIILRLLIVDSDHMGAARITAALSRLRPHAGQALDNAAVPSIQDAYRELLNFRPNVILIDVLSTGLRDSITFVQHTRTAHPTVVFVLYCSAEQFKQKSREVYSGWGLRLKHYFLLDKSTSQSDFDNAVLFNLVRAQLDLYTYGVQGSLSQVAHETGGYRLSATQLSKLDAQVVQLSRQIQAMRNEDVHKGRSRALSLLSSRPQLFVIMSFADDLQDVYEMGIKEFLKSQCNLDVFRMDERYPNGLIIQAIYEEIHNSTAIIAELTHPTPNCYYELGFADALGKPVVRLAREGTQLPFDINQYPLLFYKNIASLRVKLKGALRDLKILGRDKS